MPCRKHERGDPRNVERIRQGAVGELRLRQMRERVVAGIAAPVLDVVDEPLVLDTDEVALVALQSGELRRTAEPVVITLWDAEEIRDRDHREREAVVRDELARTPLDESVELLVGEAPQELFVLGETLRCEQPTQERAVRGVLRRIERREVVTQRQAVAVLLDELGHVVALERHGEAGERARHRVRRRERGRVHVDGARLLVGPATQHRPQRRGVESVMQSNGAGR